MVKGFTRTRLKHDLRLRKLCVKATTTIFPSMMRITLRGDDLTGFSAPGPADHVKAFFPDPLTSTITVPQFTSEGIRQPVSGKVIARDYTPLELRADGPHGPELDIDFVLHGDDGPASSWTRQATPGDSLTIAGPRGSHLPPPNIEHLIVVADETALPATRRWLSYAGNNIPVTALLSVRNSDATSYLDSDAPHSLRWFFGNDRSTQVEIALRELTVTDRTFFFLAGEATALIPLRRYLRRDLRLPASQVDASGYWKRGEVNLDHHAPLDPSDPD